MGLFKLSFFLETILSAILTLSTFNIKKNELKTFKYNNINLKFYLN